MRPRSRNTKTCCGTEKTALPSKIMPNCRHGNCSEWCFQRLRGVPIDSHSVCSWSVLIWTWTTWLFVMEHFSIRRGTNARLTASAPNLSAAFCRSTAWHIWTRPRHWRRLRLCETFMSHLATQEHRFGPKNLAIICYKLQVPRVGDNWPTGPSRRFLRSLRPLQLPETTVRPYSRQVRKSRARARLQPHGRT